MSTTVLIAVLVSATLARQRPRTAWFSSTDIEGRPRVVGRAIDIGCYERSLVGMTIILR